MSRLDVGEQAANQGGRHRRQMPSEGLLAGVLGVDRERLEVRK